jgi:hypothetical protein
MNLLKILNNRYSVKEFDATKKYPIQIFNKRPLRLSPST